MNWIQRLFDEMAELITVISAKFNTLNTNKEDKSNKKQDLTSTSANDYPSVPAVNSGLTDTLQAAQTYADTKIQQNNGNYIPLTQKGANNGVATLGANGQIPANQIPAVAITDTFVVANQAAMLALNVQKGDVAIRTDLNKTFILQQEPASTLANWKEMLNPASGVQSVGLSAPTGFSVTGSPVTNNGTLGLAFASGYSLPTNAKQTQWDAAYNHSEDMGNANTTIPDWSTQLENQVNF